MLARPFLGETNRLYAGPPSDFAAPPAFPARAALDRLPYFDSISTNCGKVAWMLNCSGSPM